MSRSSYGAEQTVGVVLSSNQCISERGELYYPQDTPSKDYSLDFVVPVCDYNRPLSALEKKVFELLLKEQHIIDIVEGALGSSNSCEKKKRETAVALNHQFMRIAEEYGMRYSYFFIKRMTMHLGRLPTLCQAVGRVFQDFEKYEILGEVPHDVGTLD
jgi:hypothetical protein